MIFWTVGMIHLKILLFPFLIEVKEWSLSFERNCYIIPNSLVYVADSEEGHT